MTSPQILSVGQYSDRGAKEQNQDSYGVQLPDEPALNYKGIVAVIADGVSSCDNGRMASEASVQSLLADYYCTSDSWTVKTSVEKVLRATNSWLYGQGQQGHAAHKGLASTLSALVVKSATVHLFHVGDTRIYRLRGDTLELLSRDHRVWVSDDKNYLTRALGIDLRLDIDYSNFLLEAGDTFVLTTDGVHEYVADGLIQTRIREHADNLDRAAREIATQALASGSPDNVTCLIVRFDRLPKVADDEVFRKLTELPFPPDLGAGMKLDGYRILREIHASKRTQVYLAVDEDSGQQVVLKTPSVNYADDPAYLELFCHEEWVGSRVHGNHVARVINPERPRRFLYCVVEYIDGQTLRGWMNDHPEPELAEVRNIVAQLARGLTAFHRLEMIHQDLKPENAMIDPAGTVKIIDFGSTKIAGIEEISTPVQRLNLLGTRSYTAPEYLQGYAGSPRSDVFALGVIAYEMLTGHLPYGDKYDEGTLRRLEYTSARHWDPELPVWIDKALEKAVAKRPENRYAQTSEFVHDLHNPNPEFLLQQREPLIKRYPVGFWRSVALLSLLGNLALVLTLWQRR
ncbi:MAG TPA: bifunctional protein-serine/threonine kinase/phosphatase [Porticoccaceae bacterium]|nr:bifunctional protein-serine/threonine kinase/phosphatase [Porticoccaceae bacterium]